MPAVKHLEGLVKLDSNWLDLHLQILARLTELYGDYCKTFEVRPHPEVCMALEDLGISLQKAIERSRS